MLGRIDRLSALHPLAISVTWGAGGSTKDRSLDLAGLTQSEYGIETILHLTCTNMEGGMIDDALKVRNGYVSFNIMLKIQLERERTGCSKYPSSARR